MSRSRLVVIGGVAAGMSAASRARKLSPEMDITVLEKSREVSYGACGLPYFIAGAVPRPDDLLVYDARFFREKRNIDVRLEHEAIEIEPGRRRVIALSPGARPIEFPYDSLIVATGAAPQINLPGSQLGGVFTVNDLATAVRLRDWIVSKRPQSAVIVGSSYIGLEMVEALHGCGLTVTLIEQSATLAPGFSANIEKMLRETLAIHGVSIATETEALEIVSDASGHAHQVAASGGRSFGAQVVLLATGVSPRTDLARAAGLQMGPTGAIAVDERMQTSVAGIYAAGDCAETLHLVTGRPTYFPLGTTANKQGRVAGENAAGGNARFEGIVGTLVTKVFDLGLARTGLTAAEARHNGFRPDEVTIDSRTHAKYLGGTKLTLTLVWDSASEMFLGCQIGGDPGAAKRIDTAAVALHARMRISQMLHLDLAYAPPMATVWDPLLIAANEAAKLILTRGAGLRRRNE
jgi:NADPH-dependent 2,4-dienoyl-CoA reductase/sulfur reductase-like enzyme